MKLVGFLFLLTSLFPYLMFFGVGTNTDNQIYAFAFGLLFLLLNLIFGKKVKSSYFLYAISIVTLLAVIYILGVDKGIISYLAGIYGYVVLLILPISAKFLFEYFSTKIIEKTVLTAYIIWISVGVMQLLDPYLLSGWRMRAVITEGRGVISLSNEPAYFSIVLILLTLILLNLNFNKYKKLILFTLLASGLLAKSSVGLIYSLVLLLFFMLETKISLKRIVAIFILFLTMSIPLYLLASSLQGERISYIINSLWYNPIILLTTDASLNIRFAHAVLSIKGFFENFLLPHGVSAWAEYYKTQVLLNREYFIEPLNRLDNSDGRIITIHGRFLFELGIFSLIIYTFWFKTLKNTPLFKKNIAVIVVMGINGLTISNPLLSILLGLLLFKKEECNSGSTK